MDTLSLIFKFIISVILALYVSIYIFALIDDALRRQHIKKVKNAEQEERVLTAIPLRNDDIPHSLRRVTYEYIAEGNRYYMHRFCANPANPIKIFYVKDPGSPAPIEWDSTVQSFLIDLFTAMSGTGIFWFLVLL